MALLLTVKIRQIVTVLDSEKVITALLKLERTIRCSLPSANKYCVDQKSDTPYKFAELPFPDVKKE